MKRAVVTWADGAKWEELDLIESFKAFQSLLKIWSWLKGYTPPGMEL